MIWKICPLQFGDPAWLPAWLQPYEHPNDGFHARSQENGTPVAVKCLRLLRKKLNINRVIARKQKFQAAATACNNFRMLESCYKDVPKQQLGPCSQELYHYASYDDQPEENCPDQSKILCTSSLQRITEPSALAVQDEIVPLLGNPYFTSIMTESHIHRDFILKIPSSFSQFLRPSSALMVLYCRSNEWVVKCCVYDHKEQLENGWEKFVVDNKLRIGDGCVFELMNFKESFPLRFKVQILNGQVPWSALARPGD